MHLSDYMTLAGWNDKKAAEKIGRSRETISRIRRRKVRPDWATIERIRVATGGAVTADDFAQLEAAE